MAKTIGLYFLAYQSVLEKFETKNTNDLGLISQPVKDLQAWKQDMTHMPFMNV